MSTLAWLIAFPGLPLVAGSFWFSAFMRYRSLIIGAGLYEPPHGDEFFTFGRREGVHERISRSRAVIDARVRAGELGPDASWWLQVLNATWIVFAGSIPVGAVGALAMPSILRVLEMQLGWSADFASAVVLTFVAWAWVVVIQIANFAARREGRPPIGSTLLRILGLGVGISAVILSWTTRR